MLLTGVFGDRVSTLGLFLWVIKMPLTEHQAAAALPIIKTLASMNRPQQCVLEGYAGVGKTYTTAHIAKTLIDQGYSVCAAAPTHKAIGVLRDNLPAGVYTNTAQAALGLRYSPRAQGLTNTGAHKLAGADVLIIDEASMVDEQMYDTTQEVIKAAKVNVLWVGDPAQLSPVGNGYNPSPVFTKVSERYTLSKVTRQAEGSAIIQASMYLRKCYEQNTAPEINEMLARVEGKDDVVIVERANAVDWLVSAGKTGLNARFISYTNRVNEDINRQVLAITHPEGAPRFLPGDAITFGTGFGISISTDQLGTVIDNEGVFNWGAVDLPCYKLRVSTGGNEVTVYTPVEAGAYLRALKMLKDQFNQARIGGDSVERNRAGLAIEEFQEAYADIRHMYAMTAHKAQGSTIDVAMVDWHSMVGHSNIAEACRLLYVACTRPSKYLVLVV